MYFDKHIESATFLMRPFMPLRSTGGLLLAIFLAAPLSLLAQEGHASQGPDLSAGTFFTEGWGQPWTHHERSTPDMALLRVTTNFLERELRVDYSRTDVRDNPKLQSSELANGLIAYGLNRRFMIEIIQNVQWNKDAHGIAASGSGGGGLARFQLVDSATQSASFQVKVAVPNKGIGQTQTSLAYAFAGWQDLHAWFPSLGRTGLYGSLQFENLQGPAKAGSRTKGLSADVSLAHTWTQPDTRGFRNFTTFAEVFATRDLDGPSEGHTVATITPGIRSWFAKGHSITLGEDFPLGARGATLRVLRLTYILNF
jgi:hypothetical protein